MASVTCRRCGQALEFSGQRPLFCAYCGQPLDPSRLDATIEYSPAPDVGDLTVAGPSGTSSSFDDEPTQLAGYRLLRRIGEGGMGAVFEAEDEAHGRRVAVKILSNRIGAGPESIDRFCQEGRLAATISHPRCVFVLAADEYQGRPYIVMELMTGQTLQGMVDQRGPLPVEEAVAKLLDVIDGLTEAHRLGVIHRDVKPSNCFLEADGRVKVGDFGLSKSLTADVRLTRTGSFIGTPLYASAEQIKGDPVDARTDVYSVCATLFFLLTGHPPFEAVDAAAVLARIVSESPQSLREHVPDIPIGLESVIMRGLDRDRDRRWRSMAELRDALLPFAPHPIPDAPRTVRLAAFGVDLGVIFLLFLAVHLLAFRTFLGEVGGLTIVDLLIWLAYFTPTEGLWGGSPGKRLMRLRVFRDDRRAEPGLLRAALRILSHYAIVFLPWYVVVTLLERAWGDRLDDLTPEFWMFLAANLALPALGFGVLCSTMRRSNGDRGLHELLSGTRTVRLPRAIRRREQQQPNRRRSARDSSVIRRPAGVLSRVGPYKVQGAVRWEPGRKVLAAEDSGLGREVWVVLAPPGSDPPEQARRQLNRSTRSRWLSGGQVAEGRWDAFTAPSGAPLADVAGPDGIPWPEFRPMIVELVEELNASLADGTLPSFLSVDQVWVEPDGRVQLVDPLGGSSSPGDDASNSPDTAQDDHRARDLLGKVARLGLEGGRARLLGDPRKPIRAPVPRHAREWLDRLSGPGRAFTSVSEVRGGLQAIEGEPDELGFVPRANRVGVFVASIPVRLAVTTLVLRILEVSGLPSRFGGNEGPFGLGLATAVAVTFSLVFVGLAMALAASSRCRWLAGVIGAVLVRNDGLEPSRLRCALRELAAWGPPLVLMLIGFGIRYGSVGAVPGWLVVVSWLLPVVWIGLDLSHDLISPGRTLHDRIARTRLVPL